MPYRPAPAPSQCRCLRVSQAQRPRERRPEPAPPHLLRDARQLPSATISRPRRSSSPGAGHRCLGVNPAHLFATVFEEDDEAEGLWLRLLEPASRAGWCAAGRRTTSGPWATPAPAARAARPYVDRFPERPAVDFATGADEGRYRRSGTWSSCNSIETPSRLSPLPNPSIDTGAGLERVASVLQGAASNYDTDLFRPLIEAASALAGHRYGGTMAEGDVAARVIADHLRAVAFLLADGVIPGNEGRGYVLRRLLRRALRHGMRLGLAEPFLHRLLPVVGEMLGPPTPNSGPPRSASAATIASEGEVPHHRGRRCREIQDAIEELRREGKSELPGAVVFRLYDTLGLPLELVREIAEEERVSVDEAGFTAELERQRALPKGHRRRWQARAGGASAARRGRDERV
ncbi:MAG: alanine--tRNA ligase-related protein [Thermoanaerobaculia bacterium]